MNLDHDKFTESSVPVLLSLFDLHNLGFILNCFSIQSLEPLIKNLWIMMYLPLADRILLDPVPPAPLLLGLLK